MESQSPAGPLTNPIWIYGDDDDTLFRLIALGTGKLSPGDAFGTLGYRRKGSEAAVGPMPPFGDVIKSEDDLWKIIAWIRSVYCGRERQAVESTVANATARLLLDPLKLKAIHPVPLNPVAAPTQAIQRVPGWHLSCGEPVAKLGVWNTARLTDGG